MKVTCQECDREVAYRTVETNTRYEDGEFVTTYHCPHCEARLENLRGE